MTCLLCICVVDILHIYMYLMQCYYKDILLCSTSSHLDICHDPLHLKISYFIFSNYLISCTITILYFSSFTLCHPITDCLSLLECILFTIVLAVVQTNWMWHCIKWVFVIHQERWLWKYKKVQLTNRLLLFKAGLLQI